MSANQHTGQQVAARTSRTVTTRRIRLYTFVPVALATGAAILLAALGLYIASVRGDQIAVERQVRETRRAIESTLDSLAVDQEAVALWNDFIIALRKAPPDLEWVHTNIGAYLNNLSKHDQVYVLSANDTPLYAQIDGAQAAPTRYTDVAGGLVHLVETVRGRLPDRNNPHERLPGITLHPQNTVRTSERAVHATEVVTIFGRPAAASVIRIMPYTNEVAAEPAGGEALLVSIRFLDRAFLEEFSKQHLIEAPRFSQSTDTNPGEYAWPLISGNGDQIGYFTWRPELPGTGVIASVLPFAVVATIILVGIMAVLAAWLHRTMQLQQCTIIELRTSEAQAQHLAFHDGLTGLANRAKFNDRLDKEVEHARVGIPTAVLLLDLDRFKHVNDTLGHLAGDTLIKGVASRLIHLVGQNDLVARLGGDEFAVLRPNAFSYREIETLCQQIIEALQLPFDLLGNSAFVGVSIGVAVAPDAGSERIDLLRKADIALYRAKAEGRNRVCLFSTAMDDSVKLRSSIEEELRIALASGDGLRVYYQPQVSCTTGAVVGFEALIRWQHPTHGLISPDRFIPVAEETGLITQLGEWVLREACIASQRWPDFFIAVNLSPAQFRVAGFAERVVGIVRECGATPSRIELEVTEGLLLGDTEAISASIKRLHQAGFAIALDDFGTGYSSLSYLHRFKVDKIKIDRSFIQNLGRDADAAAIVAAILTLGHAMGMSVTAEGVETAQQYDFLEAAGCDVTQGYLFSRPLPEQALEPFLANLATQPLLRQILP